ncbi:zinc finger CCCH domain-containing protein 14 [Spodoptera frugiperda]|uniref:Zinc finger CCCH domain-containing protein 14 n=1 Tax=Spodoptera frugiperda TaxID=7108 RepID=A0A9R0D2G4_SPOFR|nr:zinc finger CCCH domain-containing protein 14 [Spodoptera frugiperda]
MDVVGSEIGQKMRSAIKAKLTELGCYVDDELPDYVMVMVANKRTRAQMEDDLQLFLGDNTELFVNWLHQVLKKLQEVTVATPLKTAEREKSKERSDSKERKSKEKKTKEKQKKSDVKKSKKKDKEKLFRKKDDKKIHKTKKKSKHHDIIRPNIPPLLMNMEKESEPSITDVFAGQILKNHGITLEVTQEESKPEKKPVVVEPKRPILPIIDPATISSQPEQLETEEDSRRNSLSSLGAPKEDQIKEINQIEAKIQGLKQKLAEQLDSMSDDEDFLNIRTEAEELMNDFAEDVFQEISQQAPQVPAPVTVTPPMEQSKSPSPPPLPKPTEPPKELPKDPIETLPHIELKLPKRPVRDRLGIREEPKKPEVKEKEAKRTESPERFTPEREPNFWPPNKSAKSRLGEHPDASKRSSVPEEKVVEKPEPPPKKLTSKVSVLENRPSRASCASVVRVRPRPRVSTPANSLLLRAVADAHKSLLNAPPKVETEPQIKRALVLPMRRCVEAQKIVIQVPADTSQVDDRGDSISLGDNDSEDEKSSKVASDVDREEYIPAPITKKIVNSEYTPSKRNEGRTASRKDDTLIIETINIHNPSVDKDKNTQFIVTMDGYHPNAFLAKKLLTEGLLSEEDEIKKLESSDTVKTPEIKETKAVEEEKKEAPQKKRLSNSSAESETQVIIKKEDKVEKRKSTEVLKLDPVPVKKRRASPIVFDVDKKKEEKEPERVRERTESASSDQHVTVATVTNTHKYDSVPPLSAAERKLVWCRSFPLCRYGSACAFAHPRCKFAAACTRRNCVYSHAHNALTPPTTPVSPVIASHVVPAANYKTISAVVPNMCKFYPNCVNPTCHYYHPKPCRYGKACVNKLECNFYHADVPAKWRYPV